MGNVGKETARTSVLTPYVIAFFLLLLMTEVDGSRRSTAPWTHDWSTMTAQMWVDFASRKYTDWPSDAQWEFIAKNYAIVSIEKCFAQRVAKWNWGSGGSTVLAAKKLKSFNPKIKVLAYFNVALSYSYCYRWGAEFDANPQWWFRLDNGDVKKQGRSIWQNMSNPDFFDWFLNEVTNISSNATDKQLIDGIFADKLKSANQFDPMRGVSKSRWDRFLYAQANFINATRYKIHEEWAPNSKLISNSITSSGPGKQPGEWLIPYTDIGAVEHFISHEFISNLNGSLIPEDYQQNVETVRAYIAAGKNVVVKGWPGPMERADKWKPSYGPTPTTYAGKAEAALDLLYTVLAAYLIMAEEQTFFSYTWAWTADSGIFPCCDGTCAGPCGWYPDLYRPLGKPLTPSGQRMSDGGPHWVYERQFEYVHVIFNASNVTMSKLTWRTLTPTATNTVTVTPAETRTDTHTETVTQAPTHTGTITATTTTAVTPAETHTGTATPAETQTGTDSATVTAATHTGTNTVTITPLETHTGTATVTATPAQAHSSDVPSSGLGRSSDVPPIPSYLHGRGSSSSQDHQPRSDTGSATSSGMNTPSPMASSGMNTPSPMASSGMNTPSPMMASSSFAGTPSPMASSGMNTPSPMASSGLNTPSSMASMATPSPSSPSALTSATEPAAIVGSTSAAAATSSLGSSSKESASSSPSPSASSDHSGGIVAPVTSSSMMSAPPTRDEDSSSSIGKGIKGVGGNAAAAGLDDSTPASVVAAAVVIPLVLVALIVGIFLVVRSRRRRLWREGEGNSDGLLLDGEERILTGAILQYEEMITQQQEAKKGEDEAEEKPPTFNRGGSWDTGPPVREGELSGSNNPVPLPFVSPTSPLRDAGPKRAEGEESTTTLFNLDALEDTVDDLVPPPGLDAAAAADQAMAANRAQPSLPDLSDDDDSDAPPPSSDDDDLSPVNLASSTSDDLEMGDLDF